ncbi:MAG: C69 family dipeptidase [Actinomycetes bacterium]
MCDTFVALGDSTTDGAVILGKNSDREPNEAHELVMVEATDHGADESVRCTYIEIPQVAHTHQVLLAKPYWIWGAEMGVNEHAVAIGNEAVFTKAPREDQPGLLGMDLLRLGLERGDTAQTTLAVITGLLESHGQTGQAGHTHDLQYDNSFIIADPTQAWILETFGRDWVARQIEHTDSISNALTTETTWDRSSVGLGGADTQINIARTNSDFLYTRFSDAAARQCRTSQALSEMRGHIAVVDAMALLRDHGPHGNQPGWSPSHALMGANVCMHAGFGPIRSSQSTGSLVAHLSPAGPTMWLTGTSAPCTSVFKPVWFDSGLPDLGRTPGAHFDAEALWWRHELLHRATLRDYPHRSATFRSDLAALETSIVQRADSVGDSAKDRAELSVEAFSQVQAAETQWLKRVQDLPPRISRIDLVRDLPYRRAWDDFSRAAHMS